jgi:hypothetical protein
VLGRSARISSLLHNAEMVVAGWVSWNKQKEAEVSIEFRSRRDDPSFMTSSGTIWTITHAAGMAPICLAWLGPCLASMHSSAYTMSSVPQYNSDKDDVSSHPQLATRSAFRSTQSHRRAALTRSCKWPGRRRRGE